MKKISKYIPHSILSSKIWNTDMTLKNDVSEKLNLIADSFIDYLGIDIDVIDITITGSYANYNYTPYSDIDLHILVNFKNLGEDLDLVEEFFNAKEKYWKFNHDITIKGIEVEIYPQNINEKQISSGIYSILSDHWQIKPKKFKTDIDIEGITKKVNFLKREINIVLGKSINSRTITPIKKILKKIKRMRKAGLEKAGELSDENISYKILRDDGYLQKLFDKRNDIQDLSFSL